jgi:hypothetical protein
MQYLVRDLVFRLHRLPAASYNRRQLQPSRVTLRQTQQRRVILELSFVSRSRWTVATRPRPYPLALSGFVKYDRPV